MSPQTQGTPQDEQAIRNLVSQFSAAWAKNDAQALAACFTAEGDLINPVGHVARGRTEVQKLLTDEQNTRFKGTRINITQKHLRFLKPDIAVADHEFEVTGIQGPQSTMKGLATFVLRREADKWLIDCARPMAPVPIPS